ncbi:MAG: alginate O-acetyltransferase AlgF [Ketobacteraceae bacterium]|nr:alginate O-acetyltransferase AlgF [Ketobacteraceae bacterium]
MRLNRIIFSVLAFLMAGYAYANEDALYAREAPAGASFVRIFNASTSVGPMDVSVDGKLFTDLNLFSATPYYVVTDNNIAVVVSGKKTTLEPGKDKAYTIVATDTDMLVIEDTIFESRRKALISFYNLVNSSALSLKANDGKVDVISNVGFGQRLQRQINATTLSFSIHSEDKSLATTPTVRLERGEVSSLFVVGAPELPRPVWVKNEIDASR